MNIHLSGPFPSISAPYLPDLPVPVSVSATVPPRIMVVVVVAVVVFVLRAELAWVPVLPVALVVLQLIVPTLVVVVLQHHGFAGSAAPVVVVMVVVPVVMVIVVVMIVVPVAHRVVVHLRSCIVLVLHNHAPPARLGVDRFAAWEQLHVQGLLGLVVVVVGPGRGGGCGGTVPVVVVVVDVLGPLGLCAPQRPLLVVFLLLLFL